jgi:hypothetical protein
LETRHPLASPIQKFNEFPKKTDHKLSENENINIINEQDLMVDVPDRIAVSKGIWNKISIQAKANKPVDTTESGLIKHDYCDSFSSVMLIQKDSCYSDVAGGRNGFGSGIDLICSVEHGVHFFSQIAQMKNVLLLGIMERKQLRLEQGLRTFPYDYPDSKAFYRDYLSDHNENEYSPEDIYDLITDVLQTKNITAYQSGNNSSEDYLEQVYISFPWGGNPKEYSLVYECMNERECDRLWKDKQAIPHLELDRNVIGFLTSTTYSLLRSHSFAIGFISSQSLRLISKLQRHKKALVVLVGNEDCKHLYPALVYHMSSQRI